jgi:DNA adenine methylase
MFFALGAKKAFLTDINPQVARTYTAIKYDPIGVAKLLSTIPHDRGAFDRLRQLDPECCTDAEAAARLIFLMKACFNGVYRENNRRQFNTPWGGKVYRLPDMASLIAVQNRLASVDISNCDFEEVVEKTERDDFVYLDPPYPQIRYRGEFGVRFLEQDVERLIGVCEGLDRKGAKVMISYVTDTKLFSALKHWRTIEVHSNRSVASRCQFRGIARERVFLNYD